MFIIIKLKSLTGIESANSSKYAKRESKKWELGSSKISKKQKKKTEKGEMKSSETPRTRREVKVIWSRERQHETEILKKEGRVCSGYGLMAMSRNDSENF